MSCAAALGGVLLGTETVRSGWTLTCLTDVEELNVAAAATPANARVIEGKIKKVEGTFERLQIVHAQYCQKAKIGLGSSDSAEFMRGQVKMKVKSVTAAREALGEDDEEDKVKEGVNAAQDEQFQQLVIPGVGGN